MTAHTPFAKRFVLENKRATLCGMTLETGFVLAKQGHPATLERLWKIGAATFDCVASVRVMAIGATDFTLQHWVVMRQLERRAHLRMALEAGGGRFSWINDRPALAAALNMQTPRPMARLAPHVLGIITGSLQARVCRGWKTARDCFVTGCALLGSDELGARNAWRRNEGTI